MSKPTAAPCDLEAIRFRAILGARIAIKLAMVSNENGTDACAIADCVGTDIPAMAAEIKALRSRVSCLEDAIDAAKRVSYRSRDHQ